ncbi:MAG TPA: nucleotide exchange factor GrpE [Candidatus Moranbacteria bacterium]|nr:nucleotide exchange factor GrpE [Candidatus Moranbacteria bacterium]
MQKKQHKNEDSQKEDDIEKDIKDVEDLSTDKVEEIVVKQGGEMSELEKKNVEYLNGWKRCQADFENYKKIQAESQRDSMKYASQNIILQILPVLDNFQASIEHIPDDQKGGAWVQGIMYIQKQLEGVLLENGVDEIQAEPGSNFDPKFHEAVADKECKTCKGEVEYENKIDRVISKGYKIGDRILRPARVIVK